MKDVHAWTEVSIAPGNAEEFKQLAKEMIAIVQAEEPGAKGYTWYLNADETVCHIHEWFEDSAAFMAHATGRAVGEKLGSMIALGGFSRFEIHGDLSPEAEQLVGALATAKFGYLNGIER
ncbi:MAG: antibiotic biosynthesis monooxygenase [Actinomycetota bacterium]